MDVRFVLRTHRLLAWQLHERNCVFELDGLNSKRARAVMEAVRTRFDAEGILWRISASAPEAAASAAAVTRRPRGTSPRLIQAR
jgi:hypothetical protein